MGMRQVSEAKVPQTPHWLQQPHTGPKTPRKLGHWPSTDGSSGGPVSTGIAPPSGSVGGGGKQNPMPSESRPHCPFGKQHGRIAFTSCGQSERSQVGSGGGG